MTGSLPIDQWFPLLDLVRLVMLKEEAKSELLKRIGNILTLINQVLGTLKEGNAPKATTIMALRVVSLLSFLTAPIILIGLQLLLVERVVHTGTFCCKF